MNTETEYKDPKDLRDIPLDRLKWEGNRHGNQFQQWIDFFNVEAAMRISTGKSGQSGYGEFSEIERWSIFSNRYLLMEREHLSDFKLFTKEEVLRMIHDAYVRGFQDHRYADDPNTEWMESEKEYMKERQKI